MRTPLLAWQFVRCRWDAVLQPTGNGAVDWDQLYVRLSRVHASRPIRFRGVFTDGGCDERLEQYWVRAPSSILLLH
jgi:hypothetical protein